MSLTRVRKSAPTMGSVHIDTPLSNVSVGYINEAPSLARRVFPQVPVQKASDRYFVWNKGDMLRNSAQRRAPGTEPAEVELRLSNDSYLTAEWSVREKLADEIARNADIDLTAPIARSLTGMIMLAETLEFASTYMVGSVWSTDNTLTGGSEWSNPAVDPVANVRTAVRTINLATGGMYPGNCMVMNDEVADVLVQHPQIRGLMPITALQNVPRDQRASFLSAVFGLEVVIEMRSYNAAAMNVTASTATMTAAVTDNVLICHKSPNPGLTVPSAGYTFVWSEFDGGGAVRRYRAADEGLKAEYLEANSYMDQKVVAADCGYLFIDVLA